MIQKNIIITRPKSDDNQLIESIKKLDSDIQIVHFPTIKIDFLDVQVSLSGVTHIVFTSQNGVKGFFKNKNTALPKLIQLCCIGKKTAQTLETFGYKAQIVSVGNTAEEFADELAEKHISQHHNVLLALGNIAGNAIEEKLTNICKVARIDVYKTSPRFVSQNELEKIKNIPFDAVVFTSPSTFENFIAITRLTPEKLHGKIACIGRTTAAKVLEMGYEPSLISPSAQSDVFAEEIVRFLQ